ncbi:MAG: flagella basal body P-ring formation protein FlgA [Candidatus Tokpelaia sp. JSC189]|nr:MAG: flagella basal body P-ring formation protein FlgA [Candidatus Tokpelaia sp. JSC189]
MMMVRALFLPVCFLILIGSFSQAFADKVDFLVPSRTIYPGQIISEMGLNKKSFYIKADAVSLYVSDIGQILNKTAKGTLIAGKPIAISALGNPILINRGQITKLIFSSGDLSIMATGIALQPAAAGEFVKVRNVDSGRVIVGTVMQDGNVQVGIQ